MTELYFRKRDGEWVLTHEASDAYDRLAELLMSKYQYRYPNVGRVTYSHVDEHGCRTITIMDRMDADHPWDGKYVFYGKI